MYGQSTTQEIQHKNFFYPKETMGTTIMAVKYDGGVIACADSSIFWLSKEHHQEEYTQSIELQIKLILYTIISQFWEVDMLVNHNKLLIKLDILLILMLMNKENFHMLKLSRECFKK